MMDLSRLARKVHAGAVGCGVLGKRVVALVGDADFGN
jgi:hypothetical protein